MNTARPASRLRITHGACESPLMRFAFGSAPDDPLAVPCRHLAGPRGECWSAGDILESAETAGAAWAHAEDYAMAALSLPVTEADCARYVAAVEEFTAARRPLLAAAC